MADYVKVLSTSDLAEGQGKVVQAGGKAIAVFNVGGTVYALDNTCLHRGGPLGEGMLEGGVVTCPWHMWEYDVRTGEKVGAPTVKVATYAVQVDGSEIKVAV
ncbi:MAG TPA: non-heme iron oxygenase ferredoxin subunit [Terriglobia bacterium]|nr:non-heme iron oxygenase ferredoxin subunit [Terriglobia bacterium]